MAQKEEQIKQGEAILLPLSIPHQDFAVTKIDILDAQAQAFHQAQTAAIQDPGHQLGHTIHPGDHLHGFGVGQDDRQRFGFFGAQDLFRDFDLHLEHMTIEKEQCIERLTSTGSVHGFWVEAETCLSIARWLRKAWISAEPMPLGWHKQPCLLLWKKI